TSTSAIYDAFALGRNDPRVLIGLRYLLRALGRRVRRTAIHALSHATPHPDIVWYKDNWIPPSVKKALGPHFRWTTDEVASILEAAPLAEFHRGQLGESAYMLLHEDPGVRETVEAAAVAALRQSRYELAETALYLMLYWLGGNAPDALHKFLREYPEAANLPLMPEIRATLGEHGYLTLFYQAPRDAHRCAEADGRLPRPRLASGAQD